MPGKTTDASGDLSNAPEKSSPTEHQHPRISLPKGMWVAWYGGAEHQISRVGTLGTGGIFICVAAAPPVGTPLILAFEVPGGQVQAQVIVRSIVPGKGMGLEFTRLGAKDRLLLQRLCSSACFVEAPNKPRHRRRPVRPTPPVSLPLLPLSLPVLP